MLLTEFFEPFVELIHHLVQNFRQRRDLECDSRSEFKFPRYFKLNFSLFFVNATFNPVLKKVSNRKDMIRVSWLDLYTVFPRFNRSGAYFKFRVTLRRCHSPWLDQLY